MRSYLSFAFSLVVSSVMTSMTGGCSRNDIEAVNLSNEGDKAKASNPDDALSKYQQANGLDPDNIRILLRLVQTYTKKEMWKEVAETCTKAENKMKEKKMAPHANFYYMHGMALARQAAKGAGSWGDAKSPLEEAVKLDPNLADAYFELAEVLLSQDDENGALATYTKAIQAKPDEAQYYGPLADLYIRLNMLEQADQTLTAGLSFVKEGNKHLFQLHSLLGDIQEKKGNLSGAITSYETAKRACGACNEPGQPIAFFNLGAAYARANPPRKSDAINNLASFQKVICKGNAAARYAEQCSQAQQMMTSVGANAP
jgi:tetratricopeptide (TPR) repeat protein